MQLNHIVAAVDQSEEGRAAVRAALSLSRQAGDRVTALRVESLLSEIRDGSAAPSYLKSIVESEVDSRRARGAVAMAVRYGLPAVEIGRFAEDTEAGLVVLGRKHRSTSQRLFLGDTADEVARRSRVPCLSVRAREDQGFDRVLASVDGGVRGMSVLLAALDVTRHIGGRLRVVTVEAGIRADSPGASIPTTKSAQLTQSIDQIRLGENPGHGSWDVEATGDSPLVIRHGQVVEEILAEVASFGADILVIGYHRGGPAGVIEAGSVARRLLHQAECAVLTVPL